MLILDILTAIKWLYAVHDLVHARLYSEIESIAVDLEAETKLEAPWTDRTGNARRTIEGIAEKDPGDDSKYYVGVCGNMPYSPILEFGHQGQYAVLSPVISKNMHKIINRVAGAVKGQE